MNLISNNCLGGFIYRDLLKSEYKNPFIWTGICYTDFPKLIASYNEINFNNIQLESVTGSYKGWFKIILDGKFKINNIHILFNKDAETPIYKEPNLYTNRPWKYVYEKWFKRLKRMIEKPAFIFYEKVNDYSQEFMDLLVNTATEKKMKLCVITDKNVIENEYVTKIDSSNLNEMPALPTNVKAVMNFYKDEISKWLKNV